MNNSLGYSNKLFYYTFSERGSFNIVISVFFKENVNFYLMKEAINESIKCFPEFSNQVLVRNNHFVSKENTQEVVLCPEEKKDRVLGSEDTNGYLFYFSYSEKKLTISYYHGMTDIFGIMKFLRTVVFKYICKTGESLTQEEINELTPQMRLPNTEYIEDEVEKYDPYLKYGKSHIKQENADESNGAFVISDKQYDEDSISLNCFRIEIKLSDFLNTTKKMNISAAPLLVDIASRAVRETYSSENDKPVVAMLPVDLRRLFETETVVNFSDGVLIPQTMEDYDMEISDRCSKIKSSITSQINKEYFEQIMSDKVGLIDVLEASETKIGTIIEKNITLPDVEAFSPLTYAITYPGKLSFSSGLNKYIDDVVLESYVRAYSVTGYSYGDCLRINIRYRNDDDSLAKKIYEIIRSIGFDAKYIEEGIKNGDILEVKSLG